MFFLVSVLFLVGLAGWLFFNSNENIPMICGSIELVLSIVIMFGSGVMIGFVIGLLSLLNAIAILWSCIFYRIHIDMTEGWCDEWVYGNYKNFKNKLNEHTWKIDKKLKGSLLDWKTNSDICASVYIFNGVGMMMKSPIDLFLAERLVEETFNRLWEVEHSEQIR